MVVPFFALKCMHMQGIVQEMQVVTKNNLLQKQHNTRLLLGGMQLLNQPQSPSQSVATF